MKLCTALLLVLACGACDPSRSTLTAPPFSIGASVERNYRPAYWSHVPCGKSMISVFHPATYRVTFKSDDFGLFELSGRDWYDAAAGHERATIDVSPVYVDANGDGVFSDGEIARYTLVEAGFEAAR